MNCRKFQELIAAAVDRCLREPEQRAFDAHADACPSCRREFELERSTKDLLRHRTQMVSVPDRLHATILDSLSREHPPVLLTGPLSRPFVRPVLAIVVTAAVLALIVLRPPAARETSGRVSTAGFAPANVLLQSLANYHRILRGEFAPREGSGEADRVAAFFSGKTAFPVTVPRIANCTLLGGELNEHAGTPVAHLVYRTGDTLIYLYQTCWTTVQRGEIFELSAAATTDLRATGWHFERVDDGDGIVMHATGGTLCIAVAQMEPGRLREIVQNTSP